MSRFTFMTVNFLLFHTCWMATAYGSALGWEWLGPAFVLPALVLHLALLGNVAREVLYLIIAGFLGYLVESCLHYAGFFTYAFHPSGAMVAPYWSFSLWIIFASLFHGTLDWLRNRFKIRFILGAVLGPFSYYSAAVLNVLSFPGSGIVSLAVLALVWGMLFPFLAWLAYEVYPFSEIQITPAGVRTL